MSINEFKNGLTVLVDNEVWVVIEFQHVKPGKGAAFVRVKLRNMRTGYVLEKTFRGEEKIQDVFVEERKLQYQYNAGDIYHFMDQENYEEVAISKDVLGDKIKFLQDNAEVTAYYYKDQVLNVNLPNFITVAVTHTEPGIKGDTAKSGMKPATIETGASILVPLFIEIGDILKVDTRSGTYVERVR
ncbi:MAG: elongation factor P [Candidatus Omnitrophica bacterium]|nr:elongation factor P [Candidatus Omnitrophota bacterium]